MSISFLLGKIRYIAAAVTHVALFFGTRGADFRTAFCADTVVVWVNFSFALRTIHVLLLLL